MNTRFNSAQRTVMPPTFGRAVEQEEYNLIRQAGPKHFPGEQIWRDACYVEDRGNKKYRLPLIGKWLQLKEMQQDVLRAFYFFHTPEDVFKSVLLKGKPVTSTAYRLVTGVSDPDKMVADMNSQIAAQRAESSPSKEVKPDGDEMPRVVEFKFTDVEANVTAAVKVDSDKVLLREELTLFATNDAG